LQSRSVFFAVPLFVAAGLFAFYLQGKPSVFPLDDTYIHLVYARNLAAGDGLCFNAGQASFGTSSPLWVGLLALCAKTGIDLRSAALALCFLCYYFSAVLIFLVCQQVLGSRESSFYPFAAALIYLSSGNMT